MDIQKMSGVAICVGAMPNIDRARRGLTPTIDPVPDFEIAEDSDIVGGASEGHRKSNSLAPAGPSGLLRG